MPEELFDSPILQFDWLSDAKLNSESFSQNHVIAPYESVHPMCRVCTEIDVSRVWTLNVFHFLWFPL